MIGSKHDSDSIRASKEWREQHDGAGKYGKHAVPVDDSSKAFYPTLLESMIQPFYQALF